MNSPNANPTSLASVVGLNDKMTLEEAQALLTGRAMLAAEAAAREARLLATVPHVSVVTSVGVRGCVRRVMDQFPTRVTMCGEPVTELDMSVADARNLIRSGRVNEPLYLGRGKPLCPKCVAKGR